MELIRRAALAGIVVGVVGVIVLFLANPFSGTPASSMDENFTPVAPLLTPAAGLASGHGLGRTTVNTKHAVLIIIDMKYLFCRAA